MDVVYIIAVFIGLLVTQKYKRLDPVSKVTLLLFNLYWLFSLILSTAGLNKFFIPRTSTLLMLLCGVCLFNLGFHLIKINKSKLQFLDRQCLANSFDAALSSVWIRILVAISCVYVVYVISQYYEILVYEQISGGDIRAQMSENSFDYNVPFSSLFSLIFPWLIPLVRVMFCYSILYKRNYYTLLLFIFLLGHSSLAFGRMRYIIALLPIILIISFFQSKDNKLFVTKQQRVFFVGILIVLFGIMSYISSLRQDGLEESSWDEGTEMVISQITEYSSGAVVGFDAALKNSYVDKVGGYKHGMISLWPFMFPFTAISHVMGGYQYATGEWAYTSDYIEHAYPIVRSDGRLWNGLFTWNILFYNDFGFIGILLFNFLFGLLMRYCIKVVYDKPSFLSVVICSLFFIMTVLSPTKLWGYENLFGVVVFMFICVDKVVNKQKIKRFVKLLK